MNILQGPFNENDIEVVETLRKGKNIEIEILIKESKTANVTFSLVEDSQEVTPKNEELTSEDKEIINNWLEWLREQTNDIEHPSHLRNQGENER